MPVYVCVLKYFADVDHVCIRVSRGSRGCGREPGSRTQLDLWFSRGGQHNLTSTTMYAVNTMARQAAGSRAKKTSKKPAPKSTNEQEKEKPEETQTAKPSKHENTLTSLTNSILTLFNKSQHALTSHRKLVNNLHSLFLSSTEVREQIESEGGADKTIKLIGEKNFTEACYTVLDNLVTTKKGVVEADRVVRFFGAFCAFAAEHDPHKESADQTPTNRFLLHSIKYLSRGFEAKNRF